MYDNDRFLDLVNIISLVIGMQNLQENREQSAHNDIHAENEAQAKYLLTELMAKFEEQNVMLREILNILKGTNDEHRKTD